MNAQEKRTSVSRINLTRGFTVLLTLILLLALGGGLMMTRQAQAQALQNVESPQANLGTAFTYQGYLEYGSGPVDGTCDFKFSLWDASNGGAQKGSEQGITGVNVSNGYFSASLNNSGEFGGDAFQGDARYLQIKVKCSGDIDYVLMSGRVALNAAPYALSLRPGAKVQSSATSGGVVSAISSATSGDPAGLYGEANSASGAGVAGWNLTNSGGYAIYGNNTASFGTPYGVYGIASDNGNVTSYGVYGKSSSSVGTGVAGSAPTNGVYGEATATSGTNYGVYGKTLSASGHGVYGTSPSTNPLYAGVTGVNTGGGTGSGVYGYSVGGYGVYGRSTGNKAIYSDGDAHVEGDLTWQAKTSFVSISTAAFIPESYNTSTYVDYQNEGYYLKNQDSSSQWFVAPVQLPHGAIVTDLQVGWRDGSNTQATVYLRRRSMISVTDTPEEMAYVASVGTLGSTHEGVWNDDSIDFATIDNEHYTYYLDVGMQDSTEDIKLYGVVIEYTLTEPY